MNKFAVGDSLQYRAMANFDEKYVNNTHPQISAKGLLTGSMVRTLDADGAPLLKSIYYDYHGNVIQSHEIWDGATVWFIYIIQVQFKQ